MASEKKDVVMRDVRHGRARFSFKKVLSDTLQGRIYLARDKEKNEWVVVKETWKELVRLGKSRDGHRVPENFFKEQEIHKYLSSFAHAPDGFVKAIESWDDENCHYLAMEYCGGGDMFEYIRTMHTRGPLKRFVEQCAEARQRPARRHNDWTKRVRKMFRELVQTVSWMHRQGVVHLDLSLENTMLGDRKKLTTKIIDFGLSEKFSSESAMRMSNRVGKLGYMAPEVYDRAASYDPRKADVWSLGVCLFMMLVGAPPYEFPASSSPAFNFIINGRLRDVLAHWKRLPLCPQDALDLMNRIFTPESSRLTMTQLRNHSFVGLQSTPFEEDVVSRSMPMGMAGSFEGGPPEESGPDARMRGTSTTTGTPRGTTTSTTTMTKQFEIGSIQESFQSNTAKEIARSLNTDSTPGALSRTLNAIEKGINSIQAGEERAETDVPVDVRRNELMILREMVQKYLAGKTHEQASGAQRGIDGGGNGRAGINPGRKGQAIVE